MLQRKLWSSFAHCLAKHDKLIINVLTTVIKSKLKTVSSLTSSTNIVKIWAE